MSERDRILPRNIPAQPTDSAGSTSGAWHLRLLEALPLPIVIGMVAVFNATLPPASQLSRSLVFEPPFLNAILSTVFLASASFVVSFIAVKSYLKTGRLFLVLIGSGALAWGSASLLAGWLTNLSSGPNAAITISNTGALLASIFHVASGASNKRSARLNSEGIRKHVVVTVYTGVLVFTGLYATASLLGMTPQFFIPGSGQSLLRMVVLSLAAGLFGVSSILFARLNPRSRSGTLHWYFLSLALTGVGLASVFFGRAPGDPISWTGRIAMFLGGAYLLKAVFFAFREHHV